MKHISEAMTRDPNEEEKRICDKVVAVAHAWATGDLLLAEAKAACGAYERFQALRFLPRSSADKLTVQNMVEHFTLDVPMNQPRFQIVEYGTEPLPQQPINMSAPDAVQPPLWLTPAERDAAGWKKVINWDHKQVWVSPLFSMNGEWRYPPFRLPPGEERRKAELAMNVQYEAYRRDKRGKSRD
jgi:hypothetical protein